MTSPRTQTRAAARRQPPYPWLAPGVFLGSLAPLASLLMQWSEGALGANPIAQAQNQLGLTAMVFLMAALAITPARLLFGWTWAARIRREVGLFAFFYATLHFLLYALLDLGLDWPTLLEDIAKRPFITVGFAALVLLAPLAITSTNGWVRRLGYRRWQWLHRLVYVAGVLAVVHFIWRVKIDTSQPLTYAAVLAGLLLVRVGFWLRARVTR